MKETRMPLSIFADLVLRKIPRQGVSLDLMQYQIEGNFRGFRQVPTTNPHYVGVEGDGAPAGFWCYPRAGEVAVRVWDPETGRLEPDTPANAERYSGMVAARGLDDFLLPYDQTTFSEWLRLTNHLKPEAFPPPLHLEAPEKHPEGLPDDALHAWVVAKNARRFRRSFIELHGGSPASFLAEFQFAFLNWLLAGDETAFARWGYLLQVVYHAAPGDIREVPALFTGFVEAVVPQFAFLPEAAFAPGGMARFAAEMLVENIRLAAVPSLQAAVETFAQAAIRT